MARKFWTEADQAKLIELYPDTPMPALMTIFQRPAGQIYAMAAKLGLHRSAAYLASPYACRLRRGDNVGASYRFQKGHVPANKGLRRPGWSAGRMRETQFRKGQRPHTWKPVGSHRLSKEDYLCRKITDTGYPPRDWQPVHKLLWIEHHGPVLPGYAVGFINGDKTDIRLDNLVLLHRRDLMRRNSYHNNYPKELGQLIQLRGQVVRQINRRTRREEQDRRPA